MEIDACDAFRLAIRRWPIILFFAMLGAVFGLLFSTFQPPLYQAESVIAVNINYGVTQSLELIVEDRTLNRVVSLITGDEVLHTVIDQIPEEIRESREWHSPYDLRDSIQLDQRLAEWSLVAFDTDPSVASELSQIWADVSLETLDEAKIHAWRAASMINESLDVECSIVENLETNPTTRNWECQVTNLDVDREYLEGSIQTELELSRGVLPNISYELVRTASPPEKPILWGRGLLIAMGALVGLISGGIAALLFPEKVKA
ncbi:MAG: Wzz/FepE/Etk N-terminal domain-containing protein [Anaerolineales bacterium]